MAKQLSITIKEYVYDTYLSSYKGNISALFEEALVKLMEEKTGEKDNKTAKILELLAKIKEKDQEIRNFRAKLEQIGGNLKKTKLEQSLINSPMDKCINCHSFIEGQSHKFPSGYVCVPCFRNASNKDFSRWSE